MYEPKEHEEVFEVKPVGVRYICEYCNEGEMIVANSNFNGFDAFDFMKSPLIKHACTKCGKTLQLVESYPKIEWVKS